MAVSQETKMLYKPTIGIETHVQLKSKTKLFAAVGNDARHAAPNTLISHICVGMPGALPVLNEGALRLAARAAYALCTTPQKFSHFDRKHYFYPDLPKGYQITQYEDPIIKDGHVHINVDGKNKCIGITRAHLEEDAGKNTHPEGADYSLIDLNRAGTPLLEIVSEPDIGSAAEAKAFVRELYLLMKYSGVSDVDLYHGNMRFDVNISVSKSDEFGKRAEVKNLNSFRSVEAAIEFEINRQIELLENGEQIVQETRGWDEAKQKTTAQRTKEEAEDYRYMPEPDVPPLELTDEYLKDIEKEIPQLPPAIRIELAKLEIDAQVVEDIIDRQSIVPVILQMLEEHGPAHARRAAFWLIHAKPAEDSIEEAPQLQPDVASILQLSQMVEDNRLSSTSARKVFDELLSSGGSAEEIAQRLNLVQVSDEAEIEKIVAQILVDNPKAAEDVKNGEAKAIGFLVGQAMKASAGKANPKVVQNLIKKQLGV
jgi:aspartyl-tRNA(Asn)/glutamyl-tRNA(Gln) amidotransferase subunit B